MRREALGEFENLRKSLDSPRKFLKVLRGRKFVGSL